MLQAKKLPTKSSLRILGATVKLSILNVNTENLRIILCWKAAIFIRVKKYSYVMVKKLLECWDVALDIHLV